MHSTRQLHTADFLKMIGVSECSPLFNQRLRPRLRRGYPPRPSRAEQSSYIGIEDFYGVLADCE